MTTTTDPPDKISARKLPAGLFRHELDAMRCAVTGCDHRSHDDGVVIRANCHIKAPVEVRYCAVGLVMINCGACGANVVLIAVAPEDIERLNPHVTCDDPACPHALEDHCIVYRSRCAPRRDKATRKKIADGTYVAYAVGMLTITCGHGSVLETIRVRERAASA